MIRFTALIATVLLATATSVLAQAAWEVPLQAQLEKFEAAPSPTTLAEVSPVIERIALANVDAWLPNYYAARTQQLAHYMAGEDGCKKCIEKMDAFLAAAEKADNNSEVMTMRASYYQTMLSLHPMRAPYYGPKAGNLLEAAMEADPTNPRAASLAGQNAYYTPAMFGGGATVAAPLLAKAVKLFEAEAGKERGLLPTWGAERASLMHGKAVAAAE